MTTNKTLSLTGIGRHLIGNDLKLLFFTVGVALRATSTEKTTVLHLL
jgi:hypothetical protein